MNALTVLVQLRQSAKRCVCVWGQWGEELGGGFVPLVPPQEQAGGGAAPAGPTGNRSKEGPERKAGEAGRAPAGPWQLHGGRGSPCHGSCPSGLPWCPHSPDPGRGHPRTYPTGTSWLLGARGLWLTGARNLSGLFLTTTHASPMTSNLIKNYIGKP